MAQKQPAPQAYTKPDHIQISGSKVYSILRQKWVALTPEERVRQEFLFVLINEYGYSLDQIDEETPVTNRGSAQARADFLIWRTPDARKRHEHALIVIECKADNVTISLKDYAQGANYAQYEHARFFVTHNHRETKYWKVDDTRRMPNYDEIANIPHADATDKDINELLVRLKVFKEDEFAKLLHECHNVIRNREKLDPAAAFDEIAKILFVKVYVERELRAKRSRKNLFSVEYLDDQLGKHPLNTLFGQTKEAYADDKIFENDEEIRLKPATGREIVKLLERYNLSETSEDIKGIAFERFLGRTFRGEIGQFFTPRTIVEFMIRMVEPREGDVICDPASGSGGFLIRFFEIVRQQILADADRQYQEFKTKMEADKQLSPDKKAILLRERFDAIQATLDHNKPGSRLWALANRCIYGTDANDRMARTSKMNMIMHGDGHGGVHHHDGFLNVNGIFESRFDIILTNPPFGASVEASDVVHESDVTVSREAEKRYTEEYRDLYTNALARVRAAVNKPIASLFELPKGKKSKIKTEILFIERCLSLLKPGGRLGIVLPEGIFNNPSLAYVREFCENRAFIRAVVSLPQETFFSSGAAVKASLLFMQKFTEKEQADFDAKYSQARAEVEADHADTITTETKRLEDAIVEAREARNAENRKAVQKELADFQKRMAETITSETRTLLKKRFPYPIYLYAAEKVGITATGDEDQNELCRYPKDNSPVAVSKTCLELYKEFLRNQAANGKHMSVVSWSAFERWISPRSLIAAQDLPSGWTLVRVRDVVQQIHNRVKVEPAKEYRMAGVKWYGEGVFHRETVQGASMSATYVSPLVVDVLIYNWLFAWKASFAIVPKELDGCCVSNEFPQFKVDSMRVLPVYLYLFFTLDSTLRSVNVASVGSSAVSRNRFKEDEFLSFELPLPPLAVQKAIVERWCQSQEAIIAAKRKAERIAHEIKTEMENMLPK